MDLIKRGIEIKNAFKSAGRLKEILSVLARNGFDEFIVKSGLHSKIPGFVLPKSRIEERLEELQDEKFSRAIGYRLRKSFEELGPGFVKIGQLLASREDLFPPEFIEEMRLLQNEVQGMPFREVKSFVEESLEESTEKYFNSIEETPIGTASIACVYKGRLKSGEDVVIKVRRPGIVKIIETDFSLITLLVNQLEKASEDIRTLGLSKVVNDFGKSLQLELDLRIESLNCDKLRNNVKHHDRIDLFHIPKIYKDLVREDFIVMEFLEGIPFNKLNLDDEKFKAEIHEKLLSGVDNFVKTLLKDGFFHADLHGGNFLYLTSGKIGIIDFGLMGNLSARNRTNLIAIIYALVTNNFENLVYEFLDVAEYSQIPDQDLLIRDIRDCLAPYLGLSVQDTNFPLLVRAIVTTMSKHQIHLPREWFIIFRALITLDGVGKSVDIDLNIFEILDKDIRGIIDEVFSKDKAIEEGIWLAKDSLMSFRQVPRHVRWYLKDFSKSGYKHKIDIANLETSSKNLSISVQFLGYAIVSSMLIICGTLLIGKVPVLHWTEIPTVSWIFWSMSLILFLRGFVTLR